MTEPRTDRTLRFVALALQEANHKSVHVGVRNALQRALKAIWEQKDKQRAKKKVRK